jgi:hypothetical protein
VHCYVLPENTLSLLARQVLLHRYTLERRKAWVPLSSSAVFQVHKACTNVVRTETNVQARSGWMSSMREVLEQNLAKCWVLTSWLEKGKNERVEGKKGKFIHSIVECFQYNIEITQALLNSGWLPRIRRSSIVQFTLTYVLSPPLLPPAVYKVYCIERWFTFTFPLVRVRKIADPNKMNAGLARK